MAVEQTSDIGLMNTSVTSCGRPSLASSRGDTSIAAKTFMDYKALTGPGPCTLTALDFKKLEPSVHTCLLLSLYVIAYCCKCEADSLGPTAQQML